MNLYIKKIGVILSLLFVLSIAPTTVEAQCPMCRLSAETNLKNGGTEGKGLNKGILFLFFTPYIIIGGIAYFWWRGRLTPAEVEEANQ